MGYYTTIMASKKKERPSKVIEGLQRSGAGMANATRGRARTFTDRKKKASKDACRGKVKDE